MADLRTMPKCRPGSHRVRGDVQAVGRNQVPDGGCSQAELHRTTSPPAEQGPQGSRREWMDGMEIIGIT